MTASASRLSPYGQPWVFVGRRAETNAAAPVSGMNSGSPGASNGTSPDAEAEIDRQLIERAQAGDAGAFRRLVERHQRRAYAIAFALLRDEEDAREIVQEAFIRVYRGLSHFHGGSSFFTWLYRIVTNLSIDLMRRPSRRERPAAELAEPSESDELPTAARELTDPYHALERSELRAAIQKALDELPPYHRGVIVMRELEGMSYEEMASAMGVSKGTIMSRLFHARRKLERALAGAIPRAGRVNEPGAGGEGEGEDP